MVLNKKCMYWCFIHYSVISFRYYSHKLNLSYAGLIIFRVTHLEWPQEYKKWTEAYGKTPAACEAFDTSCQHPWLQQRIRQRTEANTNDFLQFIMSRLSARSEERAQRRWWWRRRSHEGHFQMLMVIAISPPSHERVYVSVTRLHFFLNQLAYLIKNHEVFLR